jgi:hypothetical protein
MQTRQYMSYDSYLWFYIQLFGQHHQSRRFFQEEIVFTETFRVGMVRNVFLRPGYVIAGRIVQTGVTKSIVGTLQ